MIMNNMQPQQTRVELTIAGSTYSILSDESATYMRELGAKVDTEMQKLMENPRISASMAAVMVALESLDKLQKADASTDNLRSQMKDYMNLNTQMESLKRENERLHEENRRLREKIG